MKYWKVTCSNGFCGCNEEFYFEEENEDKAYLMGRYFLEDEEEVEDYYYNNLKYWVDEISKEEYDEGTADYF